MATRRDRAWARARKAEVRYGVSLRKIARNINDIVKSFQGIDLDNFTQMQRALERYGNSLEPYAEAVAQRMLWDVSRANETAWIELSKTMGDELGKEIRNAPTGASMQALMYEQVTLIKSLPLEAAQRVQQLAVGSLQFGSRGENIIRDIMNTGEVSKSRAICIARTETSRASSVLTQARAEYVGSDGYVWRTSMDANVRESHRKMEGRVCEWANPPEVEPGKKYHAGCIYNCFTGDTLTTHEDVIRVFRGFYDGPLVVLQAGDATIEVTPNHPIITPRGEVPAGVLQAGDYVFQMSAESGNAVMQNVNDKQVSFQKLFESPGLVKETQFRFVFDFYGDAIKQDVDVVTHKGNLTLHRSNGSQSIGNKMITSPNRGVELYDTVRILLQIVQTLGAGFLDKLNTLFRCSLALDDLVSLCAAAEDYTVSFENAYNWVGTDFEVCRDSCRSQASLIHLDDFLLRQFKLIVGFMGFSGTTQTHLSKFPAEKFFINVDDFGGVGERHPLLNKTVRVQNVGRKDFLGHVYTMETVKGFYGVSSAMVASKNCRCTPEPILPNKYL